MAQRKTGGGNAPQDEPLPQPLNAQSDAPEDAAEYGAGDVLPGYKFRNMDIGAAAGRVASDGDSVARAVRDVVGQTDDDPDFSLRDLPGLATNERIVTLRRTEGTPRAMDILWTAIDAHSESLSFIRYAEFLEQVCVQTGARNELLSEGSRREAYTLCRHIPGADLYHYLRTATEAFLLLNCGVCPLPSVAGNRSRFGLTLSEAGYGELDPPPTLTYTEARTQLAQYMGSPSNN
ncbi:MAG TPA: hypothetical protein VFR37_05210, partial [Longimicrobium sp.]|nr:hypothetical protein [Longimicrobium sp.]